MAFSGIFTIGSAYSLFMRWQELYLLKDSLVLGLMVNLEFPYLAMGILFFVSASAGFIGALRENVALLRVYCTVVLLLMGADILLGLCVIAAPFVAKRNMHNLFSIELIEHYRDNDDFEALINYIQKTFKCCGVTVDSYRDWNRNMYFNCTKDNPSAERCSVPSSCCKPAEASRSSVDDILTRRFCGHNVLALTAADAWRLIYPRSCVDAVLNVVRRNTIYFGMIVFTLFIILMIVRIMAVTVWTEVVTLTKVYDKYYSEVHKGLKKQLARSRALQLAPRDQLVKIPSPGRSKPSTILTPSRVKVTPGPVTPARVYDRGVSLAAVPHVARFLQERQRTLVAWHCPRHNVKGLGIAHDPSCERGQSDLRAEVQDRQ